MVLYVDMKAWSPGFGTVCGEESEDVIRVTLDLLRAMISDNLVLLK